MKQKRYTYILIENCEVVGVRTSMKKIYDDFSERYKFPAYNTIARKTARAKETGNPIPINDILKISIKEVV